MKSQIFRIIAWCFAVGATVLWFLQSGAITERLAEKERLGSTLDKVRKETTAVEADSNATKANLLKEISVLEEEDGKVTEQMNAAKAQLDVLLKSVADEEASLALVKEEGAAFPEQLAQLSASKSEAEGGLVPLQREQGEIKTEHATVEVDLNATRASTEKLQGQLDALREERENLRRSYEERSAQLKENIQEPPWVYYGDTVRTKIMNVRPSMTGVFLPLGIGDGIKQDMEFLIRRLDPPAETKRSWRYKLKIVQSDYCFAVIMPEFGDQDIPMRAGEEVEMVRSGLLARESASDADQKEAP